MQYRKLGKIGWNVSSVSMGCWNIGGQWGPVPDDLAINTMKKAFDLGINLFDTADAYGSDPGYSETLVGKALQGIRGQVYIATKVGNWTRRAGHPLPFSTVHHVYLCCDASLYRLKTDYIDLYQCHIGNLKEPDIYLEAFERLKERGKIRAYGISTNSLEVLERFNRDGGSATCQINYSILNRSPEKDILPYCQENDIGTLIRGPLAQGLLADKFSSETVFTDSIRSRWNEGEAHEDFLRNVERVEKLRFLVKEGRIMLQGAFQYILAHPAISCLIPGAKDLEQIEQNAHAADSALSDEEVKKVKEISDQW